MMSFSKLGSSRGDEAQTDEMEPPHVGRYDFKFDASVNLRTISR